MKVQRRAIFTFPIGMAMECDGVRLGTVQGHLGSALRQGATYWIETRRKEGEEYIDAEDVHVYGPYPSTEMIEAMVSSEHMAVSMRERAQLVRETGAFAHYLLVANFMVARNAGALKGVTNGRALLPVS